MAAPVCCPKHNMVAYLEKTKRNAQFPEIVDFLTRSSIYYSLTVSPTFSTSLIEQFWNIATSKTVNDDEGLGQPTEPQPTPSPIQPSTTDQTPMTESSYRPDTTQDPRVNLEGTSGSQGDQVLDLQNAKDAQAAEILKLKTRIKKLEKKCKPSISHHRAWLRSVSRLSRTKKLGKKESRQSNETKELNLDVDTEVIAEDKGSGEKGGNTVSTARPEVDTARPDIDTARPKVHITNAPVSTVGVTNSTSDPEVSAVEPRTPPTTTSIFDDEDITMAQTLIKMKEEKAKEKGVSFKEVNDSSRPLRSITKHKPLPSIDPKDKGNGILVEEEPVKIKRNDRGIDQTKRDEELAHKLHEEELAEIARIQEENAAQEEASRVAIMEMFDEVQAGIDADALFAAKLQ
ncbi:hypothetical protein Tco_0684270 [Tanacetum coccineum]